MMMPVATIAASAAPGGETLSAYALTVALVASMSMALPVSTPPNAMAYAAGEVTRLDFLRTVGVIDVLGAALVVLTMVAAYAGSV